MTQAMLPRLAAALRTRAALGLRPATAPVAVFVPLGMLLGPLGTGVLSPAALSHLEVVVSVALATLGVLIGVAAGREGGRIRTLFAASTLEAFMTILVVATAALFLIGVWGLPLDLPSTIAAVALGVSASASAAPSVGAGDEPARHVAARVADLDDVLPIALGGLVIASAAEGGLSAPSNAALVAAMGLAIGVAGWLLFDRASGAERGVFVLGTLSLLGGAAAYLHGSPLLAGLAAGWFWAVAPGDTDRIAAADLQKLQHPLVVLLLITAGAAVTPSLAGVWLFAPYVVFRLTGKLIGGWAASRVAPGLAPAGLGAYLIPPGVIGIAFALNLAQVDPSASAPLVFAVAIGAIASELLALLLTPLPRPA
jgi:hypothetical protein